MKEKGKEGGRKGEGWERKGKERKGGESRGRNREVLKRRIKYLPQILNLLKKSNLPIKNFTERKRSL